MILCYKFEYFSNNNLLMQSLENCAKEFNINFKLVRNQEKIDLYVEAEIDKLEEFSNILSKKIPMSIFLGKVEVEYVDEMPKTEGTFFEKYYSLTFCTKCLEDIENKESENYKNPFIFCDSCGQDLKVDTFKLFEGEKEILEKNSLDYIKRVAKYLNDGKKVKIKTLSGEFIFYKLTKTFQYNKEKLKLLSTNLSEISKVLKITNEELNALTAIEKPILECELSDEYSIITRDRNVEVRYVNDLILHLLGVELRNYGIDFLVQNKDISFDVDMFFEASNNYEQIDIQRISIAPLNRALIVDSKYYDEKLLDIYNKFDQEDKSQFMVLLSENNLFEKSILNFYCSSLHNDGATIYSNKYDGLLEFFKYDIPDSIEDIFNKIVSSDTGARLIENYKQKFPELYNEAKKIKIDNNKDSIYNLWSCVEIILGFEKNLLNEAHFTKAKRGPRIDYKFFDKDDKLYNKKFNFARLIQSGISFKLAGVENSLIALGYIDSFVDFISLCCDSVNKNIGIDGVSLCGDFFSNKLVLELVQKYISINNKIYYNKDFPIQIQKAI